MKKQTERTLIVSLNLNILIFILNGYNTSNLLKLEYKNKNTLTFSNYLHFHATDLILYRFIKFLTQRFSVTSLNQHRTKSA